MMHRIVLMVVLLALTQSVPAHQKCDRQACSEVKQAIRDVEAKMRGGYTRAQGERYEARTARFPAH